MKVLPDKVTQKDYVWEGEYHLPALCSFLLSHQCAGSHLRSNIVYGRSGLFEESLEEESLKPVVSRSPSHFFLHNVDFHIPTLKLWHLVSSVCPLLTLDSFSVVSWDKGHSPTSVPLMLDFVPEVLSSLHSEHHLRVPQLICQMSLKKLFGYFWSLAGIF